MRHGCLTLLWAAPLLGGPLAVAEPPLTRVRSKVFDLEYRVNEASFPLETVRLWYTTDRGENWRFYGEDEDRQPPFRFHAPSEGLFGFFFVVANRAGSSAVEPQSGDLPQLWLYVDHTPPVVQVHRPWLDPRASEEPLVAIRWTAIDEHLPPRPIDLDYRAAPDGPWQPIARRVANTGRYDWHVPQGLVGRVVIRATVVDRGGHRVEAATTLELQPPGLQTPREGVSEPSGAQGDPSAADGEAGPLDEATRRRSRRLYQQGIWHRDRGEDRLAIARLRDALRLDPTMSVALVDLAGLLYAGGDYAAAIKAYQLALQQTPYSRSASEGLSRVYIARREYEEAARLLQGVLERSPDDVQAWLALGDVNVYRGDELAARDCYEKAATLQPAALDVVARAQLRLADITGLREPGQQVSRAP